MATIPTTPIEMIQEINRELFNDLKGFKDGRRNKPRKMYLSDENLQFMLERVQRIEYLVRDLLEEDN